MAADVCRLKRKGIPQRVLRQDDTNDGISMQQHDSSGKPGNAELAPPTNPDLMLPEACIVLWLAACSDSETDLLTDRELDTAARGFYQWASVTRQNQTCYDEGEDGQNYSDFESCTTPDSEFELSPQTSMLAKQVQSGEDVLIGDTLFTALEIQRWQLLLQFGLGDFDWTEDLDDLLLEAQYREDMIQQS
eukprot:969331-Rhodomonas_salina.1